ncbi:formylglycine-generating enzyme family protein, partial [filamentous cyanobacterium LEGE 11480]
TQGRCATVERLDLYLKRRVPEIVAEHGVRQNPYTIAEPIDKSHLILLPQYATLADVQQLKLEAFQAESDRQYLKAEQLWVRVLAASLADRQAIEAIKRLARIDIPRPEVPETTTPQPTEKSSTPPPPQYPTFSFEYATIAVPSLEVTKHRGSADYFTEDLGDGVSLDMVRIPGGEFWMGSPDGEEGDFLEMQRPRHKVTVPECWMGKFVVTQSQWQAIAKQSQINRSLKDDPSEFKGKNLPVESVSWLDAIEWCDRLSQQTGKTYRLPSEAEWEYACRAGTQTPFHFGETLSTDLANYRGQDWEFNGKTYSGKYGQGQYGSVLGKTTSVGTFPPNAFGLFDMHGNVGEWCEDLWHKNYKGAPIDGSVWGDRSIEEEAFRVNRGGSWDVRPAYCRSAIRYSDRATYLGDLLGFRVLCVVSRPGLL